MQLEPILNESDLLGVVMGTETAAFRDSRLDDATQVGILLSSVSKIEKYANFVQNLKEDAHLS